MPGLFANRRVKVPGQQALENRWEWESTTSGRLPDDVNSYFQSTAFLTGWCFSEDQVICRECRGVLSQVRRALTVYH